MTQLDQLPEMVQQIQSANVDDQFEATSRFRKLLSKGWSYAMMTNGESGLTVMHREKPAD